MSATSIRTADRMATHVERGIDVESILSVFRDKWWRAFRWGYRFTATLPHVDYQTAEAMRKDAAEHIYRPCGHADLAVSYRLRTAPLAAIDAAASQPNKYDARRVALIERDGSDCFYCGGPLGRDITIEHKEPRALGGTDDLGNLALAHRGCNHAVGSLPLAAKLAARAELRRKVRGLPPVPA